MNIMPENRYPAMNLPSRGQLSVSVRSLGEFLPLQDATVTLRATGVEGSPLEVLTTDISGQTPTIDLPAPSLEYSLEPTDNQPYSEYTIQVEREGFTPFTVKGIQVFPNTLALQDAELAVQRTTTPAENLLVIPPNTLFGEFPPKIPEAEIKPEPPPTGYVVLDYPVIPEFIIVHDGVPDDASAPNYYVPYRDYVKNVASCEIYSTWPAATIRANVLAISSFALNRIFTEWYRGKGKNFNITTSTAFDQKYVHQRNIYKEVSQVVDEVFANYISRPGIRQPLFTQYCDGNRVQCPNWMTQWGSKTLGDQGLPALDILRHFYGSDVYLNTANQISGVPSSFPGYNLQVGSSSAPVRTIQEQLNAISNNYPAIPKLRSDGIFGQLTKEAVETFQKVFNLPVTGIVDYPTWYKISDIYVAVKRLAELQ
ncbi:MAG: peptidoglycan-binding protein [Epulopiscium sp.]|nr:peptidoglycan-binding protein [Candidatus Epulonipiscium sp.]